MDALERAAATLKSGGIIIYPTETVYGLGCLLTFPESIKRLYRIKKREENQPTSVLFPNLNSARQYLEFNQAALGLAEHFWPGPLTICLPTRKNVPVALLGLGRSLGARVPGFEWDLRLLERVKTPILAPSANFKGEPPAVRLAEIDKALSELVDYVVDIEPGGGQPSTVVSFAENGGYNLIREGDITDKMIQRVLSQEKQQ